jgi:hypothetical protein
MSNGCTHISANNYDPSATVYDHTCEYVVKATVPNLVTGLPESVCLLFKDVQDYEDKSFTLSYSVESGTWVFFHKYIPDFYFSTRENILNLKSQKLHRHNEGAPGLFYDETPENFYIDVVVRDKDKLLLQTVNWVSTVLNDSTDVHTRGSEWDTLTHISIWNSQQHTGKIALEDVFKNLKYKTSRNTNGAWSFNDFRNVLVSRGTQFIADLFDEYALDPSQVGDKPWYSKELLQDKYFVIRFEFDNLSGKSVILHEVNVQATKAIR